MCCVILGRPSLPSEPGASPYSEDVADPLPGPFLTPTLKQTPQHLTSGQVQAEPGLDASRGPVGNIWTNWSLVGSIPCLALPHLTSTALDSV